VRCYDEDPAARATVHERVRANLQAFVGAGLLRPIGRTNLSRILCCQTEAPRSPTWRLSLEAVKEDLAKQELFARLESWFLPRRSGLQLFDVSDLAVRLAIAAAGASRGDALVQPAHLVPLVKSCPAPRPTRQRRATMELLQRIGKQPLRLRKSCPVSW
jgi:hypothetical protein